MKRAEHTPQSVIADEIFNESDQWDLDDLGMQAASDIITRLEKYGFVVVQKQNAITAQPQNRKTRAPIQS